MKERVNEIGAEQYGDTQANQRFKHGSVPLKVAHKRAHRDPSAPEKRPQGRRKSSRALSASHDAAPDMPMVDVKTPFGN
jgi:hypothetical protein